MAVAPGIEIPVTTHYDPAGIDQLKNDVESAKAKITESTDKMGTSYLRLAGQMSHVLTAGLMLESTWDRVARGQMNVLEGMLRTIPTLVSMATAIWAVVGAEKARGIASAIATAFSGPAGLALLTAGIVAAAGATAFVVSQIPSHHFEGPVIKGGIYNLAKGQEVSWKRNSIEINIYGATQPRATGEAVVYSLRLAGVA